MEPIVLQGQDQLTLTIDRGCFVLEYRKRGTQTRVIPMSRIILLEVVPPSEDHRGYLYFRTPVANKPVKPAVKGRDVNSDDDMLFFDDEDAYKTALMIQERFIEYVSK